MRSIPCFLAALAAGCGSEPSPAKLQDPSGSFASSSPAATSASSASAGAGGAGGENASSASAGGGGSAPLASECAVSSGFFVGGLAFQSPTPATLGAMLGALTYDPTSRPLSIVLVAKKAEAAQIAVSATFPGDMGELFPPGEAPALEPVALDPAGFHTPSPLVEGWMRLVDDDGPKVVRLVAIQVHVDGKAGCSQLLGTLDAVIPPTEGGVFLHHGDDAGTIQELGDSGATSGGQADGWPIHALFTGESMSFDFGSL